jgi:serine/threonine protein kinase
VLNIAFYTLRFVQQNTTIPIPRLHGYATQSQSQVGFAYMLINYVDGDTLFNVGLSSLDEMQKTRLYHQLADIFIQLRLHEFPCVGSLSIATDTSEWSLSSARRPLSIDLNQQEVEGLQPGHIVHPNDTYASTVDYIYSQLQLVLNWFSKGRNSVLNEFDAEIALYSLYQFRALAVEWVNPAYKHGPFILMHGDLRPTNIIVDKDLTIVAIIDWEWSRIVPAQLFVPPTWLTGRELSGIRSYFAQKDYIAELFKLRGIVPTRESLVPTPPNGHPLSKIWSQLEANHSFLIAAGLLSLTSII